MKILFTNFHHRNGGGHVTYIMNLLKGLGHNHELSVGTPDTSRLYRYASELAHVQVYDMRFTSRIIPLLKEVWRLRKFLRQQRFDIVHVNASADHRHIMLACIALRHRPKIIWTKHNCHPVQSVGHYLRARLATDQIVAVSSYVAEILKYSAYRGIPVHVIRHGVDTDFFSPVDASEKAALRRSIFGCALDDTLVLGSSAGTDTDKGWLDLAEAVARLPEPQRQRVRVIVAGDSPGKEKRDTVAGLGLSAQFIFPGLLDDVRPVLAACDAGFVLSYHEALSYACRETLSLGLPTLVSDAGGLPENLDDGVQGWIVPAHDVGAIASILKKILADCAALSAMGVAARERSEREFNLPLFSQRTVAVYDRALGAGTDP